MVLFYHILLQLDAFTPYKGFLLQQLMVDSAEVAAMGTEGAECNENLDSSSLLLSREWDNTWLRLSDKNMVEPLFVSFRSLRQKEKIPA